MNYLKAIEKDISECQLLKKEVIKRLEENGLNIWDEEYPSDELIKEDILHSNARVIKENSEIVAYAVFDNVQKEFGENVFDQEGLYAFSRLMVKTGYTGKHIATTLINCMLDEMKKINGVKGCGIMVHPINKNAIKMYEKIGFKFEKTQVYSFGEFHTYVYIF